MFWNSVNIPYWFLTCVNLKLRFTTVLSFLPLPKRVLHRKTVSASALKLQYLLFSLRSYSSCLCLLPLLLVFSTLPAIFRSVKCFRRLIYGVSLTSFLYTMLLSSLAQCNPASFFRAKFQNFLNIFGLLSKVCKYEHHIKLWYKCRIISLFLKFKSNLLVKSLPFVECCFCHGKPGFNFACRPGIACYHITHITKIFHILYLFWSTLICIGVAVLRFSLLVRDFKNHEGYWFYCLHFFAGFVDQVIRAPCK